MRLLRLRALGLAATLLLSTGGAASVAGAARLGRPRIVNGLTSSAFPAVGAVLAPTGFGGNGGMVSYCSGTLINCNSFLVAAHCVCLDEALSAEECLAAGIDDPNDVTVFFQHAGFVAVSAITIHPEFEFEVGSDVAVLTLATPVTGIAPLPLNRAGKPPFGTAATIVGYGITDDGLEDSGIKRFGKVVTAACVTGIPDETHVCWNVNSSPGPAGEDSSTCDGDSGGPLFLSTPAGPTLAAITSGGAPTCDSGSSWDTNVFHDLAFIDEVSGADTAPASCSALPAADSTQAVQHAFEGEFAREDTELRFDFPVAPGIGTLRIALNGEDFSGSFGPSRPNDFDLFVRFDTPPDAESEADCQDITVGPYAYCEFASPVAGTWHVLVENVEGAGAFQVTATAFSSGEPTCLGDCNSAGGVTVDEILRGVNIALGTISLDECMAFDGDASGTVTVDEILQAVNSALSGCPI